MTDLLVLCTGNAARSVMAGFMLEHLSAGRVGDPLHIVTAGTHTIDGQPMGMRTRAALARLPELADTDVRRHRSRQVHGIDLVHADLVVVMEADHVRFVRRQFPDAAAKTATIRRLCRDLAPAPPALAERVAALDWPGSRSPTTRTCSIRPGKEADAYAACADELWELCQTPHHARVSVRELSRRGPSAGPPRPGRPCAAPASGPPRRPSRRPGVRRRCSMKRRLAPSAMPTMP